MLSVWVSLMNVVYRYHRNWSVLGHRSVFLVRTLTNSALKWDEQMPEFFVRIKSFWTQKRKPYFFSFGNPNAVALFETILLPLLCLLRLHLQPVTEHVFVASIYFILFPNISASNIVTITITIHIIPLLLYIILTLLYRWSLNSYKMLVKYKVINGTYNNRTSITLYTITNII